MCGGRRSFGATTPKFTACNTMQLHRQAGVAHRAAHQADGPRTQLFSRLEGSIRVAAAGTAPVSMTLAATRCTPALLRRPCSIVAQAHGTPPREYTLSEAPKKRLAFFVSGGGSNFKAIHAAMLDGRIGAEAAVSLFRGPIPAETMLLCTQPDHMCMHDACRWSSAMCLAVAACSTRNPMVFPP